LLMRGTRKLLDPTSGAWGTKLSHTPGAFWGDRLPCTAPILGDENGPVHLRQTTAGRQSWGDPQGLSDLEHSRFKAINRPLGRGQCAWTEHELGRKSMSRKAVRAGNRCNPQTRRRCMGTIRAWIDFPDRTWPAKTREGTANKHFHTLAGRPSYLFLRPYGQHLAGLSPPGVFRDGFGVIYPSATCGRPRAANALQLGLLKPSGAPV